MASKNTLPFTRYRTRDKVVDVLEGAAVLQHTGEEYPAGVTSAAEGGGLLFQGMPIYESAFLTYDELGNPLELLPARDFEQRYELDAGQSRGPDVMKGDLGAAETTIKELRDKAIDQDVELDRERAALLAIREVAEAAIAALGLNIDNFHSQADLLAAIRDAGQPGDTAKQVIRDILKIEPAQNRDDGGRIIHLPKKIIDRAVTVV